jgi:hypothetical protein
MTKGLTVKLPKRGNLQICDNWRGITLLSVPSKVFTKILLKRIDEKIDEKLREEQAGFMKGRGCIDQIFAIRNISFGMISLFQMLLKSCCRIFEDVAIAAFNISAWMESIPGDLPFFKVLKGI